MSKPLLYPTQPSSSSPILHLSKRRTAQGKYDPSGNLIGRYLRFDCHYSRFKGEKCFILKPVHKRPADVLVSITVYLNDKRSLMWILALLFLFDSIHSKRTKVVPGTTAAFKQFLLPTAWMNSANSR